jgi:hypothetical protein
MPSPITSMSRPTASQARYTHLVTRKLVHTSSPVVAMPKCPKTTLGASRSPVVRCWCRPPRTIQVPSMNRPLTASKSQVQSAAMASGRPGQVAGVTECLSGECATKAPATAAASIMTVMGSPG